MQRIREGAFCRPYTLPRLELGSFANSVCDRSRGIHLEKYRPDIDGLRAVAVISVVLFHASVPALSGGYVGVDIFFVISGYLITRYIDQRIRAGKFSILEFYERRVRRIMPALLFLLLVASGLSLWALPDDLYNFAKSEIAAILFAPNNLVLPGSGLF